MINPQIFSDKKPALFSQSQTIVECKNKFNKWLPIFTTYCEQMGYFGQEFIKEFQNTGCTYAINLENFQEITNSLMGGSFLPAKNEIHFGQSAFSSIEDFLYTLFHESIHAIQYQKCAAIRSTIWDNHLPIALTPKSHIDLNILLERDAFTKAALFLEFYSHVKSKQLGEIKNYLSAPKTVQDNMISTSKKILDEISITSKTHINFYIDTLLHHYEEEQDYLKDNIKNREFVILDKKERFAAGNSLCINSLYHNQDQATPFKIPFNKEFAERLEKLNNLFGIKDESNLRLLNDALAKEQQKQ